jgi:hypothetical protein
MENVLKLCSMKGYFEFKNDIYPRRLWVAIGATPKELAEQFENGTDEGLVIDKSYEAVTFEEVNQKDRDLVGELVLFRSKKAMAMDIIAHEASHVCDFIEDAIGMEHGGEASAYLIGWITRCIARAKEGIGTYIDTEKDG